MKAKPASRNVRPWYVEGLTAGAFFLQAFVFGRWLRMIPPAALFLFAANVGLGWFFARSAWRGFLQARK